MLSTGVGVGGAVVIAGVVTAMEVTGIVTNGNDELIVTSVEMS